jgi:hypothetical protein
MKEYMKKIIGLLVTGLSLFASTSQSIAQWIRMDIDSVFVTSFTVGDAYLFAGTGVHTGMYRSTNNGTTWAQSGLNGRSIQSVVTSPNGKGGANIFAGSYSINCIPGSGGVFLSTDNGSIWTGAGTGQTYEDVYALVVDSIGAGGTNLFAATADCGGNGYGVFLTTNNGTTWTNVTDGLTTTCASPTCWVDALAISDTNLFAGTVGKGVFRSTDYGTTWTEVNAGLTTLYVQTFATNGTDLFMGTWGNSGGVFRSTNNGTTWTDVSAGLTNSHVQALVVIGTNLMVGTEGDGVFLSTNNGANWTQVNTGLTDTWIMSLTVVGTYLFAGSDRSGVWRRPLSEMITGVNDERTERPARFSLHQNYPNPFNPGTVISYQLLVNNWVTLKVYNVLGQEVATLVNERREAGRYEAVFDGSKLTSGVYYYRLQAGNYNETKKLLLLR